MRKKLLLASIAASLLVLVMLYAPLTTDAAANYYIEGYVADTGRIPIEGVTVSVMDNQGLVSKSETDADGFFSVGVPSNNGLMISFSIYGYSIISCPNTPINKGSDYHALNLSKASYNNQTRTYTITGSVSEMLCAIMGTYNGTIGGYVLFGTSPIKNATVALSPSAISPAVGGGSYTVQTNNKGYYEINCPIGTYTMTVSSQGFNKSGAVIVDVKDTPQTVPAVLMEKSNLKKYLGLDAAHLLMLVGVIVGIVMAVAAWFLSRRMNMPHGVEIIDDSAEIDEDTRHL